MPLLTRESLAHRFRQNWLARHPVDAPSQNLDDSLTSLSWLQNLNIMKMATPTPPASPEPQYRSVASPIDAGTRVNPNAVLNMTRAPLVKCEPGVSLPSFNLRTVGGMGGLPDWTPPTPTTPSTPTAIDPVDYKSNPYVKPPYSYATLICMAMKESKKNKITLSGIYNWITDHFMYYRVADPSWQNSIRHNLSLNKCFQKVARRKDEPGKGGFWRINPDYSDMFVNGVFKKRRSAARETLTVPPPAQKKVKREPEDVLIGGILTKNPHLLIGYHGDDLNDEGHMMATDGVHSALRGDFNWNAILHQDIEVGGVCIKTEDIIDEDPADSIACPITALSPPPSDSNSDIGLEDLLNTSDLPSSLDDPVDLSSGSPLDLTIQGAPIRPPDWWTETPSREVKGLLSPHHSSGLNTPLASPVTEGGFCHPWSESRVDIDDAMASFDLDLQNLFDEDLAAAAAISDS